MNRVVTALFTKLRDCLPPAGTVSRLTALCTKLLDCVPLAGTPFRDCSPIHNQWTFFCFVGIIPGKFKEWPGIHQAGGFVNHPVKGFFPSTEIVPVKAGNSFAIGLVNSAVTVLFMKPLVGTLFKDISPFHG